MTKDEIFAEIKAILVKDFECEEGAVTPDKFVCKDGPVFSFDQLGELPPEY